MRSNASLKEIERAARTPLCLVEDEHEPPRFYVMENERRRELLAIGDLLRARRLFSHRVQRWRGAGLRFSRSIEEAEDSTSERLTGS